MLRLKLEKTITAPIFLPQGLRPCCGPSLQRAATLSQNGRRGELCRHGPCFSHRAAHPITYKQWLEIYFVTLTLSYSSLFPRTAHSSLCSGISLFKQWGRSGGDMDPREALLAVTGF